MQLQEIIDQAREAVGSRGQFNANTGIYRLDDGRIIELKGVQHEHFVSRFKGRPHDLKAFDEATEFSESQVRFLLGWLRSAVPNQRCRAILCFNPPTTKEGEWVLSFFAPWLDPKHPNPAAPGELRWYAMVDGREVERPDGNPFEHESKRGVERITPLSRTFIPSRLVDNPALASTGYEATLQSMPEPLRSQLLYGDFRAGVGEDPWQCIPTAWVVAAMARWRPDTLRPALTCIGGDVAHGGRDQTVYAPRFGTWFGPLACYPGSETPDGITAAAFGALLVQQILGREFVRGYDRTPPTFHVDAIGYGASCSERLEQDYGFDVLPVNVASASTHTDRSGKFPCVRLRTEMYWRLREALDPDLGDNLALPPDPELLADLTAYKFKVTPQGIVLEEKDAVKARIHRSTDRGDAVALTMLGGGVPNVLSSPARVNTAPPDPWQSRYGGAGIADKRDRDRLDERPPGSGVAPARRDFGRDKDSGLGPFGGGREGSGGGFYGR
ncbi:MAG TPA: hypothetical protein PLB88_10835 [Thermoanaerobaculaceae bacterium]|nr:hypothetical protein [Thermoanaerobaculaceae bacterium]